MSHTPDLFRAIDPVPAELPLGPGALLLPSFAAPPADADCLQALMQVLAQAPLRHMLTPGGRRMTVAMSNCGAWGWTSDVDRYRYRRSDPLSDQAWPPIPPPLLALARRAAARAGYPGFRPDACLINRYGAGAKLSPHQDRDERDLSQPIVSLSLGLPARFQFGGCERRTQLRRIALESGDVVVWGGPSRLAYHGVLPLAGGEHPLTGPWRYNLSFRRAA